MAIKEGNEFIEPLEEGFNWVVTRVKNKFLNPNDGPVSSRTMKSLYA